MKNGLNINETNNSESNYNKGLKGSLKAKYKSSDKLCLEDPTLKYTYK